MLVEQARSLRGGMIAWWQDGYKHSIQSVRDFHQIIFSVVVLCQSNTTRNLSRILVRGLAIHLAFANRPSCSIENMKPSISLLIAYSSNPSKLLFQTSFGSLGFSVIFIRYFRRLSLDLIACRSDTAIGSRSHMRHGML